MARINPSLLEQLQGVIERTYDLDTGVRDIGRFVIGDEGYRNLYSESSQAGQLIEKVGSAETGGTNARAGTRTGARTGARTMVRQSGDGAMAVSVYYPDSLIDCLERNDPTRRLDDANIDAFGVLVEELDHFLVIAERFRSRGVVSLLDLELHANVTKYLAMSLFVARLRRAASLTPGDVEWIRWHLFDKGEFSDPDPDIRGRYRDAARLAARYVSALEMVPSGHRLCELRRFHRMAPQAKIAHCASQKPH